MHLLLIPGIKNRKFVSERNNIGPSICPVPTLHKSPQVCMGCTICMVPDFIKRTVSGL